MMHARFIQRWLAGVGLAAACLALGEKDKALHWLSQAMEVHNVMLPTLKALPGYDSIRDDPRYLELLECIGLPSE